MAVLRGTLRRRNGAPAECRFGAEGALKALFSEAGFSGVSEQECRFAPRIDSKIPFWQANLEMRVGAELAKMSQVEIDGLNAKIRAAFEPYRNGEVFELSSLARVATGTA